MVSCANAPEIFVHHRQYFLVVRVDSRCCETVTKELTVGLRFWYWRN